MALTPINVEDLAGTISRASAVPGNQVGHMIPTREPYFGYAFCWHATDEECETHIQQLEQARKGMG